MLAVVTSLDLGLVLGTILLILAGREGLRLFLRERIEIEGPGFRIKRGQGEEDPDDENVVDEPDRSSDKEALK